MIYTNLFLSLTKREQERVGLFFQNKTEEQIADGYAVATREQAVAIALRIYKRGSISALFTETS